MSAQKVAPLAGQTLAVVPGVETNESDGDNPFTLTDDVESADVLTSLVAGRDGRHKVVIDLDLPAQLLPSTTPGHFHLIVDKELSWSRYRRLLWALVDAGLVEYGYVSASESRGFTAVRLPWIKKKPKPQPEPVPFDDPWGVL